jgi:hypothetical protein
MGVVETGGNAARTSIFSIVWMIGWFYNAEIGFQ